MDETMLAAVVTGPGNVDLLRVPRPQPGPHDALTRTLACAFCRGTDLHLIGGTLPFCPPPPFILGHESVGEVIAVGERCRKFRVGDRVLRAGAAYAPGTPDAPRSGWGGFAEYGLLTDVETLRADDPTARPVAINPAMQQHVPPGLDPATAAMLITLKEALSSLRRARLRPDQSVLIHGTGPVGLAFATCARALGVRQVLAAGGHDGRLARMHRFGADAGINHHGGALAPVVKIATSGRGVDLVIDAVGDRARIGDLLACLAPGGTLGLYGVPEASLEEYRHFDFRVAGAPDWWSLAMLNPDEASAHEELCALVSDGRIDPAPFVTHAFPLSQFRQAVDALSEPDAVKVVLTF